MKRLLLGVLCSGVQEGRAGNRSSFNTEARQTRATVVDDMAAAQESQVRKRSHEGQARELGRRAVGSEAL